MTYIPKDHTDYKQSVRAATTAALAANTRSGNVLTANANGALAAQDGISLAVGNRLLVKNEATGANNGIYVVTSLGSAGSPWVLTRATDADASAKLNAGARVAVEQGSANGDYEFELTTNETITLNTTSLTFTLISVTNPISADIVNAKGDIIVASAADTVVRHAAGSNGQVHVYDSSQSDGLEDRFLAAYSGALVMEASGYISSGTGTGVRLLGNGDAVSAPGTTLRGFPFTFWTGQFAAVTDWTEEILLLFDLITNNTAPTGTFNLTLRDLTATGGGAGVVTGTAGSPVTGSTVAIATPGAAGHQTANSGWISAPTANTGPYGLFVQNTATIATNAEVAFSAKLFHRFVN